jgi:hypothetical protein
VTDEDEFRTAAIENRSAAGARRIGGLGVVYGKKSRLLPGGFREIANSRALAKGEADGWPHLVSRLEHRPEWLLGTTDAGTMRLRNDPKVGWTTRLTFSNADSWKTFEDPDLCAIAEAMQVLEHASLLRELADGEQGFVGLTRLGMQALQTNTVRQHLGLSDTPPTA